MAPWGAAPEWADHGSGAARDVGLWRPELQQGSSYRSLGDAALPSYDFPDSDQSIVVRAAKSHSRDAAPVLTAPQAFVQLWNSSGHSMAVPCTLWEPRCPGGYRALGHVVP